MKAPARVILLIPSTREFDRGIRRGIIHYSHVHGPWSFYEDPPAYMRQGDLRAQLRRMQNWNADGMIVLQGRLRNVNSLRLPTIVSVVTRSGNSGRYQLFCDNEQIGQMAAEALLALGVRHFAYCGLRGFEFSEVRGMTFDDAIKRAGYSTYKYCPRVQTISESSAAREKALTHWLSALPKPVGLLACNDDVARTVADTCYISGIEVPDQVAILGVDNDEHLCMSASPPLSSIALATEPSGYEAAELLAKVMTNPKMHPQNVKVRPTHIVHRQSTDSLAMEDQNIVRALRFIRANANKSIQVLDVAKVAGLSRRVLQDRFRECLRRTPLEEIHRYRVARIASLLIETNLAVSGIAEASGFNADAHLARFFSRHAGMTPLAFRKIHRTS